MIDRPAVRWTARVLTLGTLASAACFLVGLLLSLSAPDAPAAEGHGLEAVVRAALALHPWGWSMAGVLLLLGTPVAGLAATALELRRVQPREALLAVVVLGLLALAVITALAAG